MTKKTLRLVLLISCAHAMVHIYELSLPAVEQLMAKDYGFGKETSGSLSFTWRLPWGFGALLAGWLTDRYGAERMLTIFLFGCTAMCALVGMQLSLSALFVVMFAMGTLASIYHPAGLALISHETRPEDHARALGIHGVFGSLGIGGAPILAAMVFDCGFSWPGYYWLLAGLGGVLGMVFLIRFRRPETPQNQATSDDPEDAQENIDWRGFAIICCYAVTQGFIYAAVMSFLPRYLNESGISIGDLPPESVRTFLAGGVLLLGCFGQYFSGRIARPRHFEKQLAWISLASVPGLAWMAWATGSPRIFAAGAFAFVMFMLQPIYNGIVAHYTPRRRRSLCYGLTFALGLGVGSAGAMFAGISNNDQLTYGVLAGVAMLQTSIGMSLWRRRAHSERLSSETDVS